MRVKQSRPKPFVQTSSLDARASNGTFIYPATTARLETTAGGTFVNTSQALTGNGTNPDDKMSWDLEVNTSATYDGEILYTCPVADAGSIIELELNGAKCVGPVAPGWDPPLYTNQSTIPRPNGESKMKEFRALNFGTLRLEKGRGLLTLRALKIPGRSVMDVRQVNLTLRQ